METADVQRAIDAQIRRQDRLQNRLYEAILRDTLMIDTQGAVRGQVNGLSVIDLGNFVFAPADPDHCDHKAGRRRAGQHRARSEAIRRDPFQGRDDPFLFPCLALCKEPPLALSASLVFEQSYGFVEGDSASLAELCALLSNLADVPIRQSLAITGSVNQLGHAQAIGGVNEKIEGFFDICLARGLTGEQGVLIPAANVKHLMLRQDVVDAAEAGQFKIYAVENVDQAISILTGLPAGDANAKGVYPEGSVNRKVAVRLVELTKIRLSFVKQMGKKTGAKRKVD